MVKATSDATGFTVPDDEPATRRSKKPPSNLEDFVCTTTLSQTTVSANFRDQLRARYFEAIDAVLVALESRFGENDFLLFGHLETMLLNAINGSKSVDDSVSFSKNSLSKHFHLKSLEDELRCLPAYLRVYNTGQPIAVKRVTKVSTISDVMNHKPSYKMALPNVHRLLIMYHSVALSSSTAERTFSVMRRVKTWLRSTMSATSLTNKMFATIHRSILDDINTEQLADEFVSEGDAHRKNYFGH